MDKTLATVLIIRLFAFTCITMSWIVSATEADSGELIRKCDGAKMTIRCSSDSANCTQTTLSIQSKDGSTKVLGKPAGLEKYVAVGLACAKAADHTKYFVAQYGEKPFGCAFCEWYHLYSVKGNVLTHSDPPVITDTSLPPSQQQYPNNKEYNDIAKRLDLDEQEIQLIR